MRRLLLEEPEECNRDLERRLRGHPRLVCVPVANPRVRSAPSIVAKPGIKAIKLFPNYHGYALRDEPAVAICHAAAGRGIPVLVQMRVEDERSHYELLKVPGVPVEDIAAITETVPTLIVVALCPYFDEAVRLAQADNVYVDISFAETLDTLGQLCARIPARKVLFGSHTPWLYPHAAVAKLELSSIGDADRQAIGWRSASRLFGITV